MQQHTLTLPLTSDSEQGGITVARWTKNIDDYISEGDVFIEVETEKAVAEITSTESGYLTHQIVAAGDEVRAGQVVGKLSPDKPHRQPIYSLQQMAVKYSTLSGYPAQKTAKPPLPAAPVNPKVSPQKPSAPIAPSADDHGLKDEDFD